MNLYNIVSKNPMPRKPRLPVGRDMLQAAIVPAAVALVGVGAFGLGRLSRIEEAKQPLVIRANGGVAAPVAPASAGAPASGARAAGTASQGQVVASKSGAKYYLPACAGVKNIKEENKIWFAAVADAEAAGYAAAANCPGL